MSDLLIAARVHRAYDLPRTDLVGHSDPYIKLSFQSTSARTRTIENSATPTWDQTLLIAVPLAATKDASLRVELWDEDVFKDEFVASAQLSLAEILKPRSQGLEIELELARGIEAAPGGKPKVLLTLGHMLAYKGLKALLTQQRTGLLADDVKQRLYVPLQELGPDVFACVEYEGKEIDLKLLITKAQHPNNYEVFFKGRPECKIKRKVYERGHTEGPLVVYEEIKLDDLSVMADFSQLVIQWGAKRFIDRTALDTVTARYGWKGRLSFPEAVRILHGVQVDHSTQSIFMPCDGWVLVVDFDPDGVDMKALIPDTPDNRSRFYDMSHKGAVVQKSFDIFQPPRPFVGQGMGRRVKLDDVPYGTLFKDMFVDRYEMATTSARSLLELIPLRG